RFYHTRVLGIGKAGIVLIPYSRYLLFSALVYMNQNTSDLIQQLKHAWKENDAAKFKQVLHRNPELKKRINEPVAAFDSPLITQVRSPQMLDVLLEAGADINARSCWWAGGFGLLDNASLELANYAIERGAILDAHSASRLGLLSKLKELVSA